MDTISEPSESLDVVAHASASTVSSLFENRAKLRPDAIAATDGSRAFTYGLLRDRINRIAALLGRYGIVRGERIVVLCENRLEYLEIFLAAARCGAIVACQNWRLATAELHHCMTLAEPRLAFVSQTHAQAFHAADVSVPVITFGPDYEDALARSTDTHVRDVAQPEDPLLLLYTSGTTGLPKGALISHRAEIARNLVVRAEFGVAPDDTFVAWPPLYHMGAAEIALGTLMNGGKVIVVDGFDVGRLATIVGEESLGWLLIMPGMVEAFAQELERRSIKPKGVKLCGVMADLVPPHLIARMTNLLGAPYANTFGATETGCPPGSASSVPIGLEPTKLSKTQSPFCEVRLVDADDNDVADGEPGELAMRGPTLFSGYWRNDETNATDFRGGWFHMGDVFVRNPDGTLDFVDRVKYLIKSGGENIYPAEIERVLMREPGVIDVAVVRRADARWGEVPVAFVARTDETVTVDMLTSRCRLELAGFKQPKGIVFIAADDLPRSTSGKIMRHELEHRLRDGEGFQMENRPVS
jgi:acyl-CoA synthetase (AMP-forming)/AMP-acid ligase II